MNGDSFALWVPRQRETRYSYIHCLSAGYYTVDWWLNKAIPYVLPEPAIQQRRDDRDKADKAADAWETHWSWEEEGLFSLRLRYDTLRMWSRNATIMVTIWMWRHHLRSLVRFAPDGDVWFHRQGCTEAATHSKRRVGITRSPAVELSEKSVTYIEMGVKRSIHHSGTFLPYLNGSLRNGYRWIGKAWNHAALFR